MRLLITAHGPGEERGATATEYALLLTLVATVIFGGVGAFGAQVRGMFDSSCTAVVATFGQTC